MDNNSPQSVWDTYTKSWSEPDQTKRIKLMEQCLNPDCLYTDPLTQVSGYEGLSAYMSELQKNVPGVRFLITDFKSHHDRSLAHWGMVDGKGNLLSQGASFGLYGSDGRLKQMTGFFEPPNAG